MMTYQIADLVGLAAYLLLCLTQRIVLESIEHPLCIQRGWWRLAVARAMGGILSRTRPGALLALSTLFRHPAQRMRGTYSHALVTNALRVGSTGVCQTR